MLAAPAKPVLEPRPILSLLRAAGGELHLRVVSPPGARTLTLWVRPTTPGRILTVNGAPLAMSLTPGQWTQVSWATATQPVDLAIRTTGPGRIDVRYVAGIPRWPADAAPLPARPADLMAWDDSDSTFVTGTRAFTW